MAYKAYRLRITTISINLPGLPTSKIKNEYATRNLHQK